jgi:hypothetical protein
MVTVGAIAEAHARDMTCLLSGTDDKLLTLTSVALRASRHGLGNGPGARSAALEGGA